MVFAQASSSARVVPAQVSFLTIYNPAFGDTDETAYEQIFYFYSREKPEVEHRVLDGSSQGDGAAESKPKKKRNVPKTREDEQNEQLRRVGLARGMVEFANTFSDGIPVDSIETEKSRLVLQELEAGWWILASIDLTRLPAAARPSNDNDENSTSVEYSWREVSPPQLLLKQLQRAHSTFLLHHASGLNELHSRLGRGMFCATLERYWNRFVWDWDVLLHGNPSVEIYNATKLAGGGELGIGVGEEEWGSGEREVLEDFVRRTEGLVDVLVGRYGDEPVDVEEASDQKVTTIKEKEPWLGTGDHARASDGIVFSGVGALSRPSMTIVSQWMEAIFRYGEGAYGVGDNPTSRPRQQRNRRKQYGRPTNGDAARSRHTQTTEAPSRIKSPSGRAPDLRRKAMENNATPPGIPAPLVGSVERTLDQATSNVQRRVGSQDRKPEDAAEATTEGKDSQDDASYFDPEKMMNYLKLGYGSAWTLNPKGFGGQAEESPLPTPSAAAGTTEQADPEPPTLQELDPTPDVSDVEEDEEPFVQRLEQSIGKFLIGLSGDLENTEFEVDTGDENRSNPGSTTPTQSKSQRLVMRTLNLHLSKHQPVNRSISPTISDTVSGSETTKLRVVLYIHQPFIFVFLFDLQTPSLTIPGFYRSIHHQVGPLQKPLLRSTDPARIPERISMQMDSKHDGSIPNALGLYDLVYDPVKMTVRTTVPKIPTPGTLAAEGILSARSPSSMATTGESRTVSGAWYTLGIPIGAAPGSSPAASYPALAGNADSKVLKSDWTRIEALNVHTQVLNIHASTHTRLTTSEIERTVKTSRGWWIVWLRVPREPTGPSERPSSAPASGFATPNRVPTLRKQETDDTMIAEMGGGEREAFLVTKSVDSSARTGKESRIASSGRWLTPQNRDVSGSSAGQGPTSAKGVVEGVGVDARKWVEGLSRLS